MRDANGPADALTLQALLYAGGELDAAEADAFERRLGDDQSARDALSRAVSLNAIPLRPNPAYREGVCRRLRGGPWGWLLGRRSRRGYPAVWVGVGAAAVLMTLHLVPMTPPTPAPDQPVAVAPPPAPAPEPDAESEEAEVAEVWAELNGTEHLARAHEEEMRRRTRVEERSRMGRVEDRRARPLHNTSSRR
jgi:hypothetical protein